MAKGPRGEFDGTGGDNGGGASGPINPASLTGGNPADSNGGGGTGDDDDFDPAIHAGRDKRNADGSYQRKRGRKTGSKPGSNSAPKGAVNLAGIETILLSMHHMLAAATSTPELMLDEKEGKAMADAIAEVSKHYPMTIDPKTLAWINLASCATMIYGPRAYLIRQRKAQEKNAHKNSGDNVSIFPAASGNA